MADRGRKQRHDPDYIQRKVGKALEKVDVALRKAKKANSTQLNFLSSSDDSSDDDDRKMVNVLTDTKSGKTKVSTKSGTKININNVGFVQIGNNNVMNINQSLGGGASPHVEADSRLMITDTGDEKSKLQPLTEAQKKVLGDKRLVTESDLTKAVNHIGRSWRRVCRSLELPDDDIELTYQSFNGQGIKEVIYNCLLLWKQNAGRRAMLGKLVSAIYEVGNSHEVIDAFG